MSWRSSNPFNRKTPQRNANSEPSAKEKEWGRVKFNPIRKPKEEAATPWSKYKSELVQQEVEAKQQMTAIDTNSVEAKSFRKMREQSYRRNLIAAKKNEPTKWESFDDNVEGSLNTTPGATAVKIKEKPKKNEKFNKQTKLKKAETSEALISAEELVNFDSKKLSAEKSNVLRRLITKGTMLADRTQTLRTAVADMKRQQKIKKLMESAVTDIKSKEKKRK